MKLATLSNRAAELVGASVSRRGLLRRSAMAATAFSVAPVRTLVRPDPAFAAICGCSGSTCDCGSLCCDGYTEFCCTLTGANSCPPGAVLGGWWKVEGHSRCGGSARYYMDCHRTCGTCGCGANGICTGACAGTGCSCGNGSCNNRKAGCTKFRYGNCASNHACLGPIVCRVVTCRAPWTLDNTCTTTPRVDNNTRHHHRSCLEGPAVIPLVGDWDGDGRDGIGVYWRYTRRWQLRQNPNAGGANHDFTFGNAGDLPVVGDWDGDGRDGIAVYRGRTREWYIRNNAASGPVERKFTFGLPGDIPVAGDWDGDGVDGIGVFRPSTCEWFLRNHATPGPVELRFRFALPGDIPVVGDWNGDGRDGIGVYRPRTMEWYLRDTASPGQPHHRFRYGLPDDVPVPGNWDAVGADGVGVFRRHEGRWYLRNAVSGGTVHSKFEFGPRDY